MPTLKDQTKPGMVGFIDWMLRKDDLSDLQKEDLTMAKRMLELAQAEKISDWLPDLKDYYGAKVENGVTMNLSDPDDPTSVANLHANYEGYRELVRQQMKDPYRNIILKNKFGTVDLPNGTRPYTNFKTVAGSAIDLDRFKYYHMHNPSWGTIKKGDESYSFAGSEVWASRSDAASGVSLLYGERTYLDTAIKKLGYSKKSLTYTQLEEAYSNAGKYGEIGHYIFLNEANPESIVGFAAGSGGSLGHESWDQTFVTRPDTAKQAYFYTFEEYDTLVSQYLKEIGFVE